MDTVPQARDIECAVISSMMLEPETAVRKVIEAGNDIFYSPVNSIMFNAIEQLFEHGKSIDQLTVTEQLKRMEKLDTVGGEPTVCGYLGDIVGTANIDYHLKILKEKALLRKIIHLTGETRARSNEASVNPSELLQNLAWQVQELKKSQNDKKPGLSDEVREFVMTTHDNFSTTDVNNYLNLTTRDNTKKVSVILGRLLNEGLIEHAGKRHGIYRRINDQSEVIDFVNAPDETLPIVYPFGIHEYVETMPGNIVVIAGEQNAGKTAFLLNFTLLNMHRHDIWYFTSEMGNAEFKKRLMKFKDVSLADWRFRVRERSSNFHDVIRPDAVNIIDFLEIHEDFWKVGSMLKKIHDRLKQGIAVVAIQKNEDTDYGRGGTMGLEKPRIYLSLKHGECKIVKGKNWAKETVNPNGKLFRFKLVQGARFVQVSG